MEGVLLSDKPSSSPSFFLYIIIKDNHLKIIAHTVYAKKISAIDQKTAVNAALTMTPRGKKEPGLRHP